jgi:hypothetical protein
LIIVPAILHRCRGASGVLVLRWRRWGRVVPTGTVVLVYAILWRGRVSGRRRGWEIVGRGGRGRILRLRRRRRALTKGDADAELALWAAGGAEERKGDDG